MNDFRQRGFSDAAAYVDELAREGMRHLRDSNTFGEGSRLREELETVWSECQVADWDGYGAMPIELDTLRKAYPLLESLPLGVRPPSIGAEADGHMTLEWHDSPRRTLSVSISPDGELHYSALIGPNRMYGTEAFFGEFPSKLSDLINRVFAA